MLPTHRRTTPAGRPPLPAGPVGSTLAVAGEVLTGEISDRYTEHPYPVYLSRWRPGSNTHRTMRGCLDRMARLLADAPIDDASITGADTHWWRLRYPDTVGLRATLIEQEWSPAHFNKHLTALRGILKTCFHLGLISADDRGRAGDLPRDTGTRGMAGRDVPAEQRTALLAACDDDTALGARDAAMITMLYAAGLRRAELAELALSDYTTIEPGLTVRGKGNKHRDVPLADTAVPWVDAWLAVRGTSAGPLLCQLRRPDTLIRPARPISTQTIAVRLAARAQLAGIPPLTPHDLRRTLAGDLLDASVDLATVQRLLGHSSPTTTARYDRRPGRVRRRAVNTLTFPPPPRPHR